MGVHGVWRILGIQRDHGHDRVHRVIIVEQFMCPRDKTVEFAAVVLIFVVQLFTGIVVEEVTYGSRSATIEMLRISPSRTRRNLFSIPAMKKSEPCAICMEPLDNGQETRNTLHK